MFGEALVIYAVTHMSEYISFNFGVLYAGRMVNFPKRNTYLCIHNILCWYYHLILHEDYNIFSVRTYIDIHYRKANVIYIYDKVHSNRFIIYMNIIIMINLLCCVSVRINNHKYMLYLSTRVYTKLHHTHYARVQHFWAIIILYATLFSLCFKVKWRLNTRITHMENYMLSHMINLFSFVFASDCYGGIENIHLSPPLRVNAKVYFNVKQTKILRLHAAMFRT